MSPLLANQTTWADMPPHARVWVYKSAKAFSSAQRAFILSEGQNFAMQWTAHGQKLSACVDVLDDHFVVIALDEQAAGASGCSIDKSVHFVGKLERTLGLSLTNRLLVLYEGADGLRCCQVSDVAEQLRTGHMNANTIVFDDLVATKADLELRFRAPLGHTWLARFV
jgi:hypothetical protein